MTIESAIVLLVIVLIVLAIAWVAVYVAGQMQAPPPISMIIWAIALLIILVLLLRAVGVLTVVGATQPAFTAFG